MSTITAYGALAGDQPLQKLAITRRAPGAHDVQIRIAYCGVCHSDIHQVRAEWAGTRFPCVPGHEIVGHVTAVGSHVQGFKEGDLVGVGCIVDSCQHCEECDDGFENYCEDMVGTYNSPCEDDPGHTLGGYSQQVVVHERYVLRVRHPESQLAAVAPLLCAGITTYSPLRHWKVGPGQKVGVVGIGGLGHMGIKLARAMGAQVVAFTTSDSKRDAATQLGAHEVVVSRNKEEMAAHAKSLDFILNTVAAPHSLDAYLALLKRDGVLALVGAPASPHPSPNVFNLIMKRRSIAGSLIGGIPEIVADIEMIEAEQINEAYERMMEGKVKYRFVIDIAGMGA